MSLYQFNNASIGVGNYAGEAARPYVAAAILSADTIANNYVQVLQNVHSVAQLRKFSGVNIAAQTCTFTPGASGPLTLESQTLTATPLQINEQVCNKDLRATWEGMQMSGQSSAAPGDFTTYVAQYVAARVAAAVEGNLWQGNYDFDGSGSGAAVYTSFNGLCKQVMDASSSLGFHQGVAGAFTADNATNSGILTHLDAAIHGAPSEVQSDMDSVVYMSRKSLFLLQRAMAGLGTANISPVFVGSDRPLTYLGFSIVAAAGMPDDTLIFCNPNQLYFGTDLLTDHINASILDLSGVTGDDVTRVIMQFSGGTQFVDAGSISAIQRTSN